MMRPSYTLSVPTPTRCKICLPEKRGLQVDLQSLKPYVYRPLQTPSSIRALKLILEPDERHVRGTLMGIDLESKDNSYAALSYTWDAQGTPHAIECDGQQIAVTCKLYSALHRLCERRLDVAIFVDALCINQGQELEALREREKQVMMMGRIYSQAVRVIVDLGDASNDSIHAKEFLEKITSFHAAAWGNILLDASAGGSNWSADTGDIPWEPVMDLVSRPWFTRAWVIQEFVLAKQISVLLGMSYLKEDALTLGIERFDQLIIEMVSAPVSTDRYYALHSTSIAVRVGKCRKHIKMMSDVRKNLQERGSDSISLPVALSVSQGFDTTDNRDRVYSVLSTVRRFEAEKVEVKYRDSADQTSLQVSHVLIQQGYMLPLLHRLANRNPKSSCSWAVDLEVGAWTVNYIDQQILPEGTCPCPQLRACADTSLGSPLVYLESRSLQLTGFLSEKIMAVLFRPKRGWRLDCR
jgi:hypothetical protein